MTQPEAQAPSSQETKCPSECGLVLGQPTRWPGYLRHVYAFSLISEGHVATCEVLISTELRKRLTSFVLLGDGSMGHGICHT